MAGLWYKTTADSRGLRKVDIVGLTQHKSAVRRQLADACGELTIIAVADALLHVERMQLR